MEVTEVLAIQTRADSQIASLEVTKATPPPPVSVDMKDMSGGSRGALSGCHYNPIKPGAREAAQGGQFMSLPCKWGLWQEIAGLSEAWRT